MGVHVYVRVDCVFRCILNTYMYTGRSIYNFRLSISGLDAIACIANKKI